MKLNHVDLHVSNVDAARGFFERFFALRCTYHRRGEIAILEDEAGFQLGVSNLRGSPRRRIRRISTWDLCWKGRTACEKSTRASKRPGSE